MPLTQDKLLAQADSLHFELDGDYHDDQDGGGHYNDDHNDHQEDGEMARASK